MRKYVWAVPHQDLSSIIIPKYVWAVPHQDLSSIISPFNHGFRLSETVSSSGSDSIVEHLYRILLHV